MTKFQHTFYIIFVITVMLALVGGTLYMLVILEQIHDIALKLDQIEELVPRPLPDVQPRE